MEIYKLNKTAIKVFTFIIYLLWINQVQAAFSVSVTPYEGGSELRFGRLEAEIPQVKREATVTITTDVSKRYHVYQEMLMPLANSQGEVIPRDSLQIYTLQGSNARGSLEAEQTQSMPGGRMLLYTSDSAGQGDSFIVVYSLRLPAGSSGGTYRGQMMFTLEAVDGSVTSNKKYLNAAVTLESQAGLEVVTALGSRSIELQAEDLFQEKNEVLLKITGNLGQSYRLIQCLPEALRSEHNDLPDDAVSFKVREGRKGRVAEEGELRSGNTVLYTSNSSGSADNVSVSYHLKETLSAQAGLYRGKVRFFLETPMMTKGIEQPSLDFLVNIEPTFELQVSPETGGRIEFTDVKAMQPPKINEVAIGVATNLGRPYQISQKVNSLLMNEQGETIDEGEFTFYEQEVTKGGILKHPSRTEVEVGETTLFISDQQGSPAQFKIIYELTVPRDVGAGKYSSQITYTISEL